jgi:hypothetical protein
VVALVTLALTATSAPVAHASCLVRGVVCQADEAAGTGEGLVDGTIDAVGTPFDDAIDQVTDPLVDDVFNRVHDLLGGGTIDPPDPIGGGGGGSHGGPPVGEGPPDTPAPTDHGSRGTVGRRSPEGARIARPTGPTISAASGVAHPGPVDRSSGNLVGEALAGVARSLAIVLALLGLAVAFVAIQDRFDRSDPRLALAPIDSDVVEFA